MYVNVSVIGARYCCRRAQEVDLQFGLVGGVVKYVL